MGYRHGFNKGFMLGALAGVAGAIFLSTKRRRIMGTLWKLKAKADLHRRMGSLKRFTKDSYEDLVDGVLERYYAAGDVAEYELDAFAKELKRRWRDVKREFEEAASELDEDEEDDEDDE